MIEAFESAVWILAVPDHLFYYVRFLFIIFVLGNIIQFFLILWCLGPLEDQTKAPTAPSKKIQTPPAQPSPPVNDPTFARLAKLKQLLDAGLIEQSEYDSTKAKILDSI